MKKNSLFLFYFYLTTCNANVIIENYIPFFSTVTDQAGYSFIALRTFTMSNDALYLVVDPETMKTKLVPQSEMKEAVPLKHSRYQAALIHTTSAPWPLQNQGVQHATTPSSGSAFLTVDLCPSSKSFDENFFTRLIASHPSSPFPLGISVSGLWMVNHEKEFQWLQSQQKNNHLDITWINHTWHHYYVRGKENSSNFLLLPGTDVYFEIIENEKALLSRKEIPSVFIRFPGLISDRKIVETVSKLGLIPTGADAWLAKGQQIYDGSVVLVHGNGNEPLGLRMLTDSLLTTIQWLPLSQVFDDQPMAQRMNNQ
ncbi:hypothetical protein ACFFJN_04825 [Erwinia mallotivora]|uniref:hypothetical protein n=1 Tax=Erwinia mallotivora TaxID=69222 RepID=UPI0035EE541C